MNSVTRILRFAVCPVVLLKRGGNNKKIAPVESEIVFNVMYRLSSGLNNLCESAIPDIGLPSIPNTFAYDVTVGFEALCDCLLARQDSALLFWHTGR